MFQSVSGVLGVLLAAVAVVFAWRVARKQFKLMNEQDAIIKKQVSLMETLVTEYGSEFCDEGRVHVDAFCATS